MRYLLDTNIVSDLVRNPQGTIATRIAKLGEDSIFTSIVVTAELYFGLARNRSDRLAGQLETVLSGLDIQPWDAPADERYGEIRAFLQGKGKLIGANDLFIAAHALALDATLVSDNTREFSRVPGLKLENWLR
ncbi:MAG TPA: type II toxin-antitoxin system VapC family toxin [Rhizomicrobium sp.]|nr:type II toxin-antitoxin system VapC family toxin [Rhizomicrobium sp.]